MGGNDPATPPTGAAAHPGRSGGKLEQRHGGNDVVFPIDSRRARRAQAAAANLSPNKPPRSDLGHAFAITAPTSASTWRAVTDLRRRLCNGRHQHIPIPVPVAANGADPLSIRNSVHPNERQIGARIELPAGAAPGAVCVSEANTEPEAVNAVSPSARNPEVPNKPVLSPLPCGHDRRKFADSHVAVHHTARVGVIQRLGHPAHDGPPAPAPSVPTPQHQRHWCYPRTASQSTAGPRTDSPAHRTRCWGDPTAPPARPADEPGPNPGSPDNWELSTFKPPRAKSGLHQAAPCPYPRAPTPARPDTRQTPNPHSMTLSNPRMTTGNPRPPADTAPINNRSALFAQEQPPPAIRGSRRRCGVEEVYGPVADVGATDLHVNDAMLPAPPARARTGQTSRCPGGEFDSFSTLIVGPRQRSSGLPARVGLGDRDSPARAHQCGAWSATKF